MDSHKPEGKATNKYYLVEVFYRIPHPFIGWPFLIVLFNSLLYFYQKILIGNVFFSIIALLLAISTYEKNKLFVNKFISDNAFLKRDNKLKIQLDTINCLLFGKMQFFVILTIIIIRALISISLNIFDSKYLINDTITIFLILSLIFVFMGTTLILYKISSQMSYAKNSFEFYCIYRGIYSQVVFNTILIGAFLTVFGLAVILWSYMVDQLQLGSLVTGPLFFLVILNFIIGILGIRNGISETKKKMLLSLSEEINNTKNKYSILINSPNISESLYAQSQLSSLLSNQLSRGKEIEHAKEWFFDIWSLISISIPPMIYTIIRIIIDNYLAIKST